MLAVKDCFPYGKVYVQLVQGGLEAKSGVRIKEMVRQLIVIAEIPLGIHP